ncbi:MAG TPA: class I SAM-dependent methyltransferase [Candidatus Acidoferrales bacterium]|jgi:SAM-dependent methyltransferase|nr:class I SAM-dependent methyltransferase [Candidatus Acidoferrales bacterium]
MAAYRIDAFGELLLAHLETGSRVLEIGCGAGELATMLVRRGLDVVAIDRAPRDEFPAIAASLESYETPKAFDGVIAMLVLHHVDDLEGAIGKIASLLKPAGLVAIDDYGWERREASTPQARAWRDDRRELHTSAMMLESLDRAFTRLHYTDHAYFDEGVGDDRLGFTYLGRRR